ncbi:MAG: hypothetical protein ACOCP4_05810 [Candidatus Woesearchaeota archaeon]
MVITKKFKAIGTSLIALAGTAALFGTATFAWFTVGTEATASGFDFTASAAEGVQISTDAENWKSNLDASEFDTDAGGAQDGNRVTVPEMEPVSTDGSVDSGELAFYNATYESDNYTIASDDENYLQFDFYFLNDGSDALTLMLDTASSISAGEAERDTELSTRVAFVNQGSDTDPSNARALEGGTEAYLWEPNALERQSSAADQGAMLNSQYNYEGLNGDNNEETIDSTGVDGYGQFEADNYTSKVSDANSFEVGDDNAMTDISGGSEITKITTFVWMEGQDLDNSNAVSSGDVNIDFNFDTATASVDDVAYSDINADNDELTFDTTVPQGATYTAHVLQNNNDSENGQDYTELIEAVELDADSDTLTLSEPLNSEEDYTVVVTGHLTGNITSRTEESITTNA